MTDTLKDSDFRRYALLGAEARLLQIGQEAASIYQAFPELRKQGGTPRRRERTPDAAPATAGRTRRRGRMTAEQREAVRERMKRYWAQRRSSGTTTQGAGSGSQSASTGTGDAAASGARKSRAARSKSTPARRGPRKMSAAARKRISDAQKARWAKRKRANA
jgi:hypothetical protein